MGRPDTIPRRARRRGPPPDRGAPRRSPTLIAERDGPFTAADLLADARTPPPRDRPGDGLPGARRVQRAGRRRADRPAERRPRLRRLRAGPSPPRRLRALRPDDRDRRRRASATSSARSSAGPASASTATGSSCSGAARPARRPEPAIVDARELGAPSLRLGLVRRAVVLAAACSPARAARRAIPAPDALKVVATTTVLADMVAPGRRPERRRDEHRPEGRRRRDVRPSPRDIAAISEARPRRDERPRPRRLARAGHPVGRAGRAGRSARRGPAGRRRTSTDEDGEAATRTCGWTSANAEPLRRADRRGPPRADPSQADGVPGRRRRLRARLGELDAGSAPRSRRSRPRTGSSSRSTRRSRTSRRRTASRSSARSSACPARTRRPARSPRSSTRSRRPARRRSSPRRSFNPRARAGDRRRGGRRGRERPVQRLAGRPAGRHVRGPDPLGRRADRGRARRAG